MTLGALMLIGIFIAGILAGGVCVWLYQRWVWKQKRRDLRLLHEAEISAYRIEVDQLRDELLQSEARAEGWRRENDALWRYKQAREDMDDEEQTEPLLAIHLRGMSAEESQP